MSETAAVLWRSLLKWVLLAGLLAFGIYYGFNCYRVVKQSARDEAQRADVIVVFGAAQYSGRPSPVYRARLDHALELYALNMAPMVITTGGAGGDPQYSEGAVGRDYLLTHGISDRHLIAETQSDNSAESAERIAVIMRVNGMHSCIAVSDPYHLFRIKRLLERYGFVVYASGRRVPDARGFGIGRLLRESLSYTLWRLHLIRW